MKNKPTPLSTITRATLKTLAGEVYFERGVAYYNAGNVVHLHADGDGVAARVQGNALIPYLVRFWSEEQKLQWGCACPLGDEGAFCKHLVAAGLAYLSTDAIENESDMSEAMAEIRELLKAVDRSALIDMVGQQALWDEQLLAELRLLSRATTKI
jgi:uncharacterized Zn finger protein